MNHIKSFFYLIVMSLFIVNSYSAENRIIIKELGYSSATKGFVGLEFGRALSEKHVISAFVGGWSVSKKPFYGIGHKYFFEVQEQDSWFIDTEIQKNEFDDNLAINSSLFSSGGGYQWVLKDSFGVDFQLGGLYSDITGIGVQLGFNFALLF